MTVKEFKYINREISRLKAKVIRLEDDATNTAVKLSDTPGSGNSSDKIGNAVTQIADIKNEIQRLETLRNSALNRLSRDVFEENCIYMKLKLHYGWTKIAMKVGGNNKGDNIRKMCGKYKW